MSFPESPNRAKKPLLVLGLFAASSNPTSSNLSSSCVSGGLNFIALSRRSCGGNRALRASSDCRGRAVSASMTGDRADISCDRSELASELDLTDARTNDLRYESNDSLEMLKGSFSLTALR